MRHQVQPPWYSAGCADPANINLYCCNHQFRDRHVASDRQHSHRYIACLFNRRSSHLPAPCLRKICGPHRVGIIYTSFTFVIYSLAAIISFPSTISPHIEELLGCKIIAIQAVTGGDINDAFQLQTNIGTYFIKLNAASLRDMFEKEHKGLSLLRNTGTIQVPEPIAFGTLHDLQFLVTKFLHRGVITGESWSRFARQLAALHRHTSPSFGLDHDNYIGSLPQQNLQMDSWAAFYAEQRILFLIRMAFDNKLCDRKDLQMADRLCHRLDDVYPTEQPALLHGDLWGGNYMFTLDGNAAIFDPAVYYGHREMDLAMTLLFGGFDQQFYSFYHEAFPLEHGWKARTDVSQLYPLLVHLNLFGGHYYNSVQQILKKYQ